MLHSVRGFDVRAQKPILAHPPSVVPPLAAKSSLGDELTGFKDYPWLSQHLPQKSGQLPDPALYAVPVPERLSRRGRMHDIVSNFLQEHLHREGATGPFKGLPEATAFQHFDELVAGLKSAKGLQFKKLASAIAHRWVRAGLQLPLPASPSPAMAGIRFLRKAWSRDIHAGYLNITDALGALAQAGDLHPEHARKTVRRATALILAERDRQALAAKAARMLGGDAGVALRRAPTALQWRAARSDRRMKPFAEAVRRLWALPETAKATSGQLAECLWQCLEQGEKLKPHEDAGVIGQVGRAMDHLIKSRVIPPAQREAARDAAARVEMTLHLRAGLDMPRPDEFMTDPSLPPGTTHRQARDWLLSELMQAGLNPARLSAVLRSGRGCDLIQAAAFGPLGEMEAGCYAVLCETLFTMVDCGLVTRRQAREFRRQARMGVPPSDGSMAV